MLQRDSLQNVVSLYRALERPKIEDGCRFEASVEANNKIVDAIQRCRQLSSGCGRFEEILVNGVEQPYEQEIVFGQQLKLCWLLSTSGKFPFYESYEHFLKSRTTVYKGDLPESYYIASEDSLVELGNSSAEANRLKSICTLITSLSEIAHYHDEKSSAETFRLVFVINDTTNNGYHPVVLDTKFSVDDIYGPELDLRALEEIVEASKNADSHAQEKASLFRLCLADVVESTPSDKAAFTYLLRNWSDLLKKYKQSFDVYISGFSFSKIRNDLAKAEVDIASSLSKALNDVTGKLFSIPVSFAAVLTMSKLESIEENIIFVFGALIFSLIISGLVRNQLLLKRNIDSSSGMIFSQFEQKKAEYPDELQNCLDTAKATIDRQSKLLGLTLHGGRVVGWLVSLLATWMFVDKF